MDSTDYLNETPGSVGELAPSGASSTEDFWMFFSFAMILLVFVLMNYVNYLNSLVVKAERQLASQEEVIASPPPEPAKEQELHVLVEVNGASPVYVLNDDPERQPLTALELRQRLDTRFAALPADHPLKLYVHAPGDALYQWVFDATYTATETASAQNILDFNVHLVYEETPE